MTLQLTLAAIGIALAVARWISVQRRSLRSAEFAAVLVRLSAAGDLERSRRLCAAGGEASFARLVAAALAAFEGETGTGTLAALGAAERAFAEESLRVEAVLYGPLRAGGLLGAVLGATAVGLVLLEGADLGGPAVLPAILGAAATVIGVSAERRSVGILREARQHFPAILEALRVSREGS